MKRLFLIDGHSLVFKMYYAFLRRPMINSKGTDTSILFGFTKYILELISRENPTHLAVAFDPPGKTFRHEAFPEYKGTRSETPQAVIDALEPLVRICEALEIPVIMRPGFEADDVIGSFAKAAEKHGFDVYMVTVDKDYGQLLSEHIIQYKPGKSGNESELFTAEDLKSKYNISDPVQFIDILAIWGDTADNVPGIRGIGEVGAARLISEWKSIEGIYANLDKLKPKQKDAFENSRPSLELSRMLVTIKTDIPVEINEESLRVNCRYTPEAASVFEYYEFNSLRSFLGDCPETEETDHDELDCRECSASEFINALSESGTCAVSTDRDMYLVAYTGHNGYGLYHTFRLPLSSSHDGKMFISALGSNITVRGYNLKQFIKELRPGNSIPVLEDIEIMHYIVNPETSHKLEMLSQTYLHINAGRCRIKGMDHDILQNGPASEADLFSAAGTDYTEDMTETVPEQKITEAAIAYRLAPEISAVLDSNGLTGIYKTYEEPLIAVLAQMETSGISIDSAQLIEYRKKLEREMLALERDIREIADNPQLNISSPKQLGILIYEKLNLNPNFRKGAKKAYPTDEETLKALPVQHPVIEKILDYRGVRKLISTYIDPLPSFAVNGKIHPTYNQALTSTGRLSCSKPNLQNIPVRSEEGREIRKAFIPSDPDGFILSADYSQIELRIMAHLSNDPHMIDAFNEGRDIHTMTAAKIFGISENEVTPAQRRMAKTANFGIIYGISAFGLSQRLGITRQEAKKLIDDYFANFPGIEQYIRDCISRTAETGYSSTISGRRRYLPDITSKNNTTRSLAERNAVNAPIQGTAADIIKLAMTNISKRLVRDNIRSRMVLQIHDELVFDVVPGEEEILKELVREEMESVMKLSVSLTAECNLAKNLLDAH